MTVRATQRTDLERRTFVATIELRATEDDKAMPRIEGYAAVFDQLSDNLGGFREKVARGAFAKSLGGDVRALYNHNPDIILGRTKSGTLSLSEDAHGLRAVFTPPDTLTAHHVVEAMRRGDIDQMSFGFRTIADQWERGEDEDIRTLLEVDLFDVSVVTFPAYPQTDAAVRSLDAWRQSSAPALPDYDHLRRRIAAAI